MSHIEFIGPPGAGKSSLFQNLILEYDYSSWDPISAVELATDNSFPYVLKRLPNTVVRPVYKRVWHYWAIDQLYKEFIKTYPSYQNAIDIAMSRVMANETKLLWLLKRTAAKFYVASETVEDGEQVCLDEGFYYRSVSIARRSGWKLPESRYFQNVPQPSVLIAITAPTEVCLERQRQRGSIIRSPHCSARNVINQIQRLTDELCIISQDRGINVIRIENTGDIEQNIKKIEDQLQACQ